MRKVLLLCTALGLTGCREDVPPEIRAAVQWQPSGPTLQVKAPDIEAALQAGVVTAKSGLLTDGTPRRLLSFKADVSIDMIGAPSNLSEVQIVSSYANAEQTTMLLRIGAVVSTLAVACPEMEAGGTRPSVWFKNVIDEAVNEGKKKKPPKEMVMYSEHGDKRVRFEAWLGSKTMMIIIEPKARPAPKA
ncbi:hypothetical protein NH8B_0580 [Pseudogulbenkiania sp. NH8B]|uniref:hypothetical protein n=1 Tax=Pseudogulbenkiania sp. (strain NH8B) TaxID=748280 RepID=UPI0002279584|nr:hypothetical protein [Pseudogulbenkiania sp. NH8B]BAK75415.1 hypothetical protein NH8B_0580 [Pseudogulbenkiania sp. NH8B]